MTVICPQIIDEHSNYISRFISRQFVKRQATMSTFSIFLFCPFFTTFIVSRLSRFILQSKLFCGNPTLARRRDCDKSVRHILCHIFSDKVVTMLLYTCENCKVIFYILCSVLCRKRSQGGVSRISCHVPSRQIRNCANCTLCPWWLLLMMTAL